MSEPLSADELQRRWQRTLGEDADVARVDPQQTQRPAETGGTLAGLATIGQTLSHQGTLASGAAPTASDPTPGYEMIGELGRGGMGVVYRARQRSLIRDIALKFIRPEAASAGGRERFVSEALVNGLLDHPNIVPVHELGQTPAGEVYLAMKLVGGRSWKALLHPGDDGDRVAAAEYDLDRHLGVLGGVCNAIAFAHSRGIVHRDLKPENVMVGEFGEVLVMDWGIAVDIRPQVDNDQRAQHKSTITAPSGTPSYMAPELAEGRGRDIGPHTDVYLLGAILHEILTGAPPHRGASLMAVLLAASASTPAVYAADVPAGLAAIATRAMARDPAARYASIADFQAALTLYVKHRASAKIAEAAQVRLAALAGASIADATARSRQYAGYAEAVAGFRQALVLWSDNAAARNGEGRARLAYAETALAGGDLGLAEAQLDGMADEAADLRGRLATARSTALASQRSATRNRRLLVGATLAIVVGLAVGIVLVKREQAIAASERDRAEVARDAEAASRARAETGEREAAAQRDKALAAERESRRRLAVSDWAQRDAAEAQGAHGPALLWSALACEHLAAEDSDAIADARLGLALRAALLPTPLAVRAVTGHGGGRARVLAASPVAGTEFAMAIGTLVADLDGSGPIGIATFARGGNGPLELMPIKTAAHAHSAVSADGRLIAVLDQEAHDDQELHLGLWRIADDGSVVALARRPLAARNDEAAGLPDPTYGTTLRFAGSTLVITDDEDEQASLVDTPSLTVRRVPHADVPAAEAAAQPWTSRFIRWLEDRADLAPAQARFRQVGNQAVTWTPDAVMLWDLDTLAATSLAQEVWQARHPWSGAGSSVVWSDRADGIDLIDAGTGVSTAIALPAGAWHSSDCVDPWLIRSDNDGRVALIDLRDRSLRLLAIPTVAGQDADHARATITPDGHDLIALRRDDAEQPFSVWRLDLRQSPPVWSGPLRLPLAADGFDDEFIPWPESDAGGLLLEQGGSTLWIFTDHNRWTPFAMAGALDQRQARTPLIGGRRRWSWRGTIAVQTTGSRDTLQLTASPIGLDAALSRRPNAVQLFIPGEISIPRSPQLPLTGIAIDLSADGRRYLLAASGTAEPELLRSELRIDPANTQAAVALRARGMLLGSTSLERFIGTLDDDLLPASARLGVEEHSHVVLRLIARDQIFWTIGWEGACAMGSLRLDTTAVDVDRLKRIAMLASGRFVNLAGEVVRAEGDTLQFIFEHLPTQAPSR